MGKIALVALPWPNYRIPAGALGALAGYLRHYHFSVDCFYDYLDVANALGDEIYETISNDGPRLGENLYCYFLYPEKQESIRNYVCSRLKSFGLGDGATFENVIEVLGSSIDKLVSQLKDDYEWVGATTVFSQTFANVLLANRLKKVSTAKFILGGSSVSKSVGPTLLKEFPAIDFIVQGEGELPLMGLLRSPENARNNIPGVLTHGNVEKFEQGIPSEEVSNLDELPLPDYSEYANRVSEYKHAWFFFVEGSRGCWWDRSQSTGDPKNTCHFCNLNVQWNSYREKSTSKVLAEVELLTNLYENTCFSFLDNIQRKKGVEDFAVGLKNMKKEFCYTYEVRAHIDPYEFLLLAESGLTKVQFGIEGLSGNFLRRIGKGTTVIQNLQAMKLCYELGVTLLGNLLIHYPGTPQSDIEETCEVICHYGYLYPPLSLCTFWLGLGSTVERLRNQFPIKNIRNADFYKIGLPPEVYDRLKFLDLSYDDTHPSDWKEVCALVNRWDNLYCNRNPQGLILHHLCFFDQGNVLNFISLSGLRRFHMKLRGQERKLYLFLCESRNLTQIRDEFREISLPDLRQLLLHWKELKILFEESGRYLAVVPSARRDAAAARIKEAHRKKPKTIFSRSLDELSEPARLN